METDAPKPILLKDYRPSPYLIDTVHLDIALHPTETRVRSRLAVRPNPKREGRRGPLVLDGEGLVLDSVRIDGQPLSGKAAVASEASLRLSVPADEPFTLEIETRCNPEANKALSGLYLSRGIYCTQCEAQGFRRITYFLDRPDVLSVYTTRIEADPSSAPVLLSNGNLVERGTLDKGSRHYAVWKDPHPKPSYLFALVGGKLGAITSTFETASGRKVDLAIYVEPGKEDRCAWAMDCLKRSMRWDEERFGREYDLDVFNIVAVSDFNMGAMENKGLNIFNDRLVLASSKTATDNDYFNIDRVIAHEYFHNWTGNRITCRDWFQLCLKEGLTVFRDQLYSADHRSPAVQRIYDVRMLKARQFPEDAGPLAHPVRPDRFIEINNFYTATVYEKGAELCRMIHTLLGEALFRKGMDLYFERHDGEAATVENFVQCFADASGRDLGQFMTWYAQAGTPGLVCDLKYNPGKRLAELTVEQVLAPTPGQPTKKPLHVPLAIGLLGGNGNDLPLEMAGGERLANGVLEVTKRKETFRFVDVPARPVPSLLRGFSAPVNLTVDLVDADLAFLMTHDADEFNRWQASQDYAMRLLVEGVKALAKEGPAPDPKAFIDALGTIVGDDRLEPAFRAQVLALPSESDVARVIAKDIDPDAIHTVRKTLRRKIAARLGDRLEEIYQRNAVKGAYAPVPDQIGRRALRNGALTLLMARAKPADIARAVRHFESASNLTDEIAGLGSLTDARGPERAAAFERFYERWKDDHIVIDHWFGYQAASSLTGTLATVKRLMRHPLMSLQNPNKVRTLIGAFAANPTAFNRKDGAGYAFVADRCLEIDRFNPQIAARLMTAFRSWRTLESGRRKLAERTLKGVARAKPLSRDAFEIVTKMLDA
ncbi:MAG: aminopeptidase N [Hyphomicrobiaceae bacterium]|nr:aminopeptidase N [Hyphomicrobiaceae bacterium]